MKGFLLRKTLKCKNVDNHRSGVSSVISWDIIILLIYPGALLYKVSKKEYTGMSLYKNVWEYGYISSAIFFINAY